MEFYETMDLSDFWWILKPVWSTEKQWQLTLEEVPETAKNILAHLQQQQQEEEEEEEEACN